jgi:hypothetical protein
VTTISVRKIGGPDIARSLKRFREKSVPKAEARAINLVVKKARTAAVRSVAKRTKLPQKLIRYRYSISGQKKGERIRDRVKASPTQRRRYAEVSVWMRGIPLYTRGSAKIAGAQTKAGVKRRGRLYRSAFKVDKAGLVMKRQPNKKLMVPKVGIREAINRVMLVHTRGRPGRDVFKREFNRIVTLEAARIR